MILIYIVPDFILLMSYSVDAKVIDLIKFNQCQIQYPTLFKAFDNLTSKQLGYIVPKMDRHSGTKTEMIYYLLSSLKRRYIEDYTTYKNPFEFLLLDKVKFNYATIDFLVENKTICTQEWVSFLTNKLY